MAATETIELRVTGMHCASCQSRVQQSLAEQAGVVDASVNLILNTAAVTFDPTATTPERLVQAIRKPDTTRKSPVRRTRHSRSRRHVTVPSTWSFGICASRRWSVGLPRSSR